MAVDKEYLKGLLKPTQVLVDTTTNQNSTDIDGFPIFETIYVNPPINFSLVKIIAPLSVAILEDLDYVTSAPIIS